MIPDNKETYWVVFDKSQKKAKNSYSGVAKKDSLFEELKKHFTYIASINNWLNFDKAGLTVSDIQKKVKKKSFRFGGQNNLLKLSKLIRHSWIFLHDNHVLLT